VIKAILNDKASAAVSFNIAMKLKNSCDYSTAVKVLLSRTVTHKDFSSFEELIQELDQIVNSGTKLNLRYFLNQFIEEELQAEVTAYFKTVDIADLEAANAYFEGDFSMEELELMHIQFLSDVGN
ncbi:MAG: hypothetical protein EBQ97_01970, partial [Bacteroidetes bacterium]|nr:hypothetical protein [Bacteroidota bacterium]